MIIWIVEIEILANNEKMPKLYWLRVVSEKHDLSLNETSQVADILPSLARLVLKQDSNLKSYKVSHNYKLEPADYPKRLNFSIWSKA